MQIESLSIEELAAQRDKVTQTLARRALNGKRRGPTYFRHNKGGRFDPHFVCAG